MPIGPYPDFGACVAAQRAKDHGALSARRICGAIARDVGEGAAEIAAAALRLEEARSIDRRDRALRPTRAGLERALGRAWRRQGGLFARKLRAGLAMRFPQPARAVSEAPAEHEWIDLLRDAEDETEDSFLRALRAADAKAVLAGWRAGLGGHELDLAVAFNLANPRAVAFMDAHGAEFVTRINASTRDDMSALLARSAEEGWSVDVTARAIQSTFRGFSTPRSSALGLTTRAHMVATTETAAAYAEGNMVVGRTLQDEGLRMEKRWIPGPSTEDDICLGNAEQGWILLDETFGSGDARPPAHPNSLLPGALVRAPQMRAAMRAWYEGPALEISLASGRRLAITPHHYVLTPDGYGLAKTVRKGDYLISAPRPDRVAALIDPHDHYGPAAIEQIFGAALMTGGVPPVAVPAAAHHFHGDGRAMHGYVDVVRADRLLHGHAQAAAAQETSETMVERRSMGASALARQRAPSEFIGARAAAARSRVRGGHEGLALAERPMRHDDPVGLADGPRPHARTDEALVDSATAHLVFPSELRFAGPALISADRVIEVRQFRWSGHVYDLTTVPHWYIANGVIIHNCVCDVLIRSEDARGE